MHVALINCYGTAQAQVHCQFKGGDTQHNVKCACSPVLASTFPGEGQNHDECHSVNLRSYNHQVKGSNVQYDAQNDPSFTLLTRGEDRKLFCSGKQSFQGSAAVFEKKTSHATTFAVENKVCKKLF